MKSSIGCVVVCLSLLACVGCGSSDTGARGDKKQAAGGDLALSKKEASGSKAPFVDAKAPAQAPPPQLEKELERKIIYTATIKIIVDKFDNAETRLLELIEEHKGLLEKSDITGTSGVSRTGHWKVRIPPQKLADFRKAVIKLGEAEQNSLDSKDVTEEYYDLAERIKSKEKEVESYRKLYDKAIAVADNIAVKRELDRAIEELERAKGRQRVLEKLTDLTTVEVTFRERGVYTPEGKPGFGTTVSNTFSGSLNALATFGKFLVLIAVALAPWLVVLAILLAPFIIGWRFARRKLKATVDAVLPVTEGMPTNPGST